MADIFISYKRADRERAAQIAALLEQEGWTVWWDTRIVDGDRWDATIEREINAARCVVVIWSPSSIDNEKAYWVHIEAHNGRERGILVPISIGGAAPPFAFKLIQTRNLSDWHGTSRDGAAGEFLANVRLKLGQAAGAGLPPQPAPASPLNAAGQGAAEREWGVLGLDSHDDPGLVLAFAGKWEKDDPVWAYRARQKAAALEAQRQREEREREAREAEARRTAIAGRIARETDRDALFGLWREDPGAVAARLQALGFIEVASRKDGKPTSYWLKPGERFRDLDIAPEMVAVPAGEFWMGSKDGEGDADEHPRHKVAISRPFAVGRFPVTFDEWDAAVAAGGVTRKPDDYGWGRGRRPVIDVSWDDAQAYVKWLSGKTGQRYRLLSEAEWEYCCRAGTETAYSFGDTITKAQAQFSEGWGSAGKTVEVGSFPPNAFGLYDMHGNVWEWCEDCWNESYNGAPADGSAWATGDCTFRVLRGGSWLSLPQILRAARRLRDDAEYRVSIGGFRVARTLFTP